jgi:hypothetical protein
MAEHGRLEVDRLVTVRRSDGRVHPYFFEGKAKDGNRNYELRELEMLSYPFPTRNVQRLLPSAPMRYVRSSNLN